ncbi:hypothetical protein BC937DRAFT_95063 [Endogone sp. FLAS-F59071]|nr:hypothetical protein BC937DRAFT_95063 [Endogone sp. FLAS-F59071]|eukprot:RUS20494.1 hypothetical protein BC937DRAFT_95063 [Endogone sp. FLAS-F59071]
MDTNTIDFIAQDLTRKYIALRAANRRSPPSTSSGSSSSSSSSGPSTNDLARSLQRMLQVLPRTAALSLQPQNLAEQKQFLNQLQTVNWEVAKYENRILLDKALDVIPITRLYEEAESNLHLHPDDLLDDVLIKRLLAWFKRDFFTWVNEPPCDYCKGKTMRIGMSGPTSEERRFGAGNVELYMCTVCSRQTRFPRYNDPGKLLETRRGRCGEWANCFTLCCRAIGAEARYVLDTTDHVWTEVYSEHKGRWIHCDSCEEAYDQPLLYSAGWGKKPSYCIALSAEEAVDVTRRYTQNWAQVLARRNKVSEDVLAQLLRRFRQEKQAALPSERVQELRRRAEIEERELEEASRRTAVSDAEMRGRQSGRDLDLFVIGH